MTVVDILATNREQTPGKRLDAFTVIIPWWDEHLHAMYQLEPGLELESELCCLIEHITQHTYHFTPIKLTRGRKAGNPFFRAMDELVFLQW